MVTWLKGIRLIEFQYHPQKNRYIDRIPKIRALPYYLQGYSLDFKDKMQHWQKVISQHLVKNDYDAVIILGSGSEFLPHFAMRNIKTSIPCIYNFHDPFPWHVYPEPYKKPRNIPSMLLHIKVQKIIDKADVVSFPSEYLRKQMSNNFKKLNKKSVVIPHVGIRLENLPRNQEDSLVTLDESKFNLLHAGSLLGPRNPHALIKGFIKFLDENPEHRENSTLTIVGKIARENKEILNFTQENIRIIDKRVSYARSMELIREANCLLLIEAKSILSPFLPGKFSDYVIAEKPILVLSPRHSEVMRLLGDHYPYWYELNDEDNIYTHIKSLWMNWRSNNLQNPVPGSLVNYLSDTNVNEILVSSLQQCISSSSSPTA